jgi:hypothetical protein
MLLLGPFRRYLLKLWIGSIKQLMAYITEIKSQCRLVNHKTKSLLHLYNNCFRCSGWFLDRVHQGGMHAFAAFHLSNIVNRAIAQNAFDDWTGKSFAFSWNYTSWTAIRNSLDQRITCSFWDFRPVNSDFLAPSLRSIFSRWVFLKNRNNCDWIAPRMVLQVRKLASYTYSLRYQWTEYVKQFGNHNLFNRGDR